MDLCEQILVHLGTENYPGFSQPDNLSDVCSGQVRVHRHGASSCKHESVVTDQPLRRILAYDNTVIPFQESCIDKGGNSPVQILVKFPERPCAVFPLPLYVQKIKVIMFPYRLPDKVGVDKSIH